MPMNLRPYQQEAVDAVYEHLRSKDTNPCVVLPTGTGKSLVLVGVYSAGLNSRDTRESVIVAGIQSVYSKACDLGRFDLVIVDECHLIAPDGEGMYRTFLKDMKVINPNVRLIGLTATPFRLKGGAICKPENLLNEVCYEAGLKEMIAQGYLSPLVSRAGHAEADLSSVHTRAGEFVQDELASAMDDEQLVDVGCGVQGNQKTRNTTIC